MPVLGNLSIPDSTVTMQNAAGSNVNGAALILAAANGAALFISGTFVATVNFEATVDDTNWVAVETVSPTTGLRSSTASAGGMFIVAAHGATRIRARISGWVSGTVTVVGRAVGLLAGLSTAGAVPSVADSTALEASRVIKASPGTLYGLSGINNNAAVRYIQLFNSTTVPADTAVPVLVVLAPATANFSVDFGAYGRAFTTGIAVCNSTTLATKTIGAADSWFDARFV